MDSNAFADNGHEKKQNEVLYKARSPEMQEIIGGMPSWIIRWGVTVVVVLLVAIFTVAYFIKYPEITSAPVVIFNSDPPIIIKSATNGVIDSLYIRNNDTVQKGQILALFETEVDLRHLQHIDSLLHEIRTSVDLELAVAEYEWPDGSGLNELEPGYKDLLISINNYKKYGYGDKRIEYLQHIQDNIKIMMDYIHHWEEKYLIKSSIKGIVMYLQPLKEQYYASSEEELIAILPPTHNLSVVTGKIPATEYTKVKPGQKVLISLETFPMHEYGYLNGEIVTVSEVSVNNEYIVNIKLSNDLTTTNQHTIPKHAKLAGIAEIITEDKSVLNRLLSSTKLF